MTVVACMCMLAWEPTLMIEAQIVVIIVTLPTVISHPSSPECVHRVPGGPGMIQCSYYCHSTHSYQSPLLP